MHRCQCCWRSRASALLIIIIGHTAADIAGVCTRPFPGPSASRARANRGARCARIAATGIGRWQRQRGMHRLLASSANYAVPAWKRTRLVLKRVRSGLVIQGNAPEVRNTKGSLTKIDAAMPRDVLVMKWSAEDTDATDESADESRARESRERSLGARGEIQSGQARGSQAFTSSCMVGGTEKNTAAIAERLGRLNR